MVLHEVATAAMKARANGSVNLFIVADRLVDCFSETLQPNGPKSSLFIKLAVFLIISLPKLCQTYLYAKKKRRSPLMNAPIPETNL
jgi:hypothetical protein